MNNKQYILGWDVGGTKSAVVVGTAAGDILARRQWASETHNGPDAMIADFLANADAIRGELPEDFAGFTSVGVSIGGPMNARGGVIYSPPNLPGWDNIPLKSILEDKLSTPVMVEHDAAACLLAEWRWGAAKGCSYAVYLTMGTGCGAGILIDGKIYYGPAGQTPEIGHVRLTEDGPEKYGKNGCVESYTSGTGIAKLANFMFPDKFDQPVEVRKLVGLAEASDVEAKDVLELAAKMTGRTCAMICDIFSPQVTVLGSLARYLPAWWVDSINRAFHDEALAFNAKNTRLVLPELGDKLQDLSALAAALGDK